MFLLVIFFFFVLRWRGGGESYKHNSLNKTGYENSLAFGLSPVIYFSVVLPVLDHNVVEYLSLSIWVHRAFG